ncbi:bifunctional diaminohydroxyphosphoribosylaminopyrimidine deaminase/5-amino-6-(5-phosphoribosylamino)uracil reductase RibD [Beijerinckia sp. L45]|uniref:bifunctional diaminohydroxyphosphoribosylaminopyrimidine deaminase/5-amino-6-(5-phosphoribosylamino)uracil reductase RibD n=1 Tax=Beijerinckia sp. L45 TaxID=1641855 RepID=UPI00131D22FF|nr:bifunctional diaminohydroxyphosphoribosylaminopyrimidine deaminase/5-amino-6-(5-phosphoribosylamino)uracil reductase RibD [Beijerinckia sp. L45]
MTAPVDQDADRRFMDAALALGRRGFGLTAPNPSVGALIVKDGIVLARGWTAPGGRPHAEPQALAQAGAAARGATIYVTLEPCSHHGQTPPCCEAIVAAGISRVVYAVGDPNPDVAGRGAAYCRDHGLDVLGGIGDAAARRDHLGHILRMTQRRPAITLKFAETADGFVAGGPHDPRLSITGVAANGMVHVMRAMHDAIMVGVGTVLADDPLMTVRLPGVQAKPLRVVLDGGLRLPLHSRLIQTAGEAPILVLTRAESLDARGKALREIDGVEIAVVPVSASGALDLRAALRVLADRGITRIFSEGGPTVGSALIAEGLADEVILFQAEKPLGREGVPTMSGAARGMLHDPMRFRQSENLEVGTDRLHRFERMI